MCIYCSERGIASRERMPPEELAKKIHTKGMKKLDVMPGLGSLRGLGTQEVLKLSAKQLMELYEVSETSQ